MGFAALSLSYIPIPKCLNKVLDGLRQDDGVVPRPMAQFDKSFLLRFFFKKARNLFTYTNPRRG
jgi:hypothetical protein